MGVKEAQKALSVFAFYSPTLFSSKHRLLVKCKHATCALSVGIYFEEDRFQVIFNRTSMLIFFFVQQNKLLNSFPAVHFTGIQIPLRV